MAEVCLLAGGAAVAYGLELTFDYIVSGWVKLPELLLLIFLLLFTLGFGFVWYKYDLGCTMTRSEWAE